MYKKQTERVWDTDKAKGRSTENESLTGGGKDFPRSARETLRRALPRIRNHKVDYLLSEAKTEEELVQLYVAHEVVHAYINILATRGSVKYRKFLRDNFGVRFFTKEEINELECEEKEGHQ